MKLLKLVYVTERERKAFLLENPTARLTAWSYGNRPLEYWYYVEV